MAMTPYVAARTMEMARQGVHEAWPQGHQDIPHAQEKGPAVVQRTNTPRRRRDEKLKGEIYEY